MSKKRFNLALMLLLSVFVGFLYAKEADDKAFTHIVSSIKQADLMQLATADAMKPIRIKELQFSSSKVVIPPTAVPDGSTVTVSMRDFEPSYTYQEKPTTKSYFTVHASRNPKTGYVKKTMQLGFAFDSKSRICMTEGKFRPHDEVPIPLIGPSNPFVTESAPRLIGFEFQPNTYRDTYVRTFIDIKGCLDSFTVANETALDLTMPFPFNMKK